MGSDRPMDGFPTTRFLPPADPAAQFRNLKANWPLLPCAACFYLLDGGFSFDDLICTVLALLAMSYAAAYMEPQVDVLRRNGAGIHILSAASAIGIAWAKAERFLRSPRGPVASGTLPFPEGFPVGILAAVLAAGSAAAAFLLLERFWPALRGILARTGIRPSRTERRAYLTVLAACCVLGCGFHLCTRLAYGEARPFDMIYQSDSPYLVRSFSYATLSDSENGLHQPLFGLFAAPFAGLPYFAAMLLGGSPKAVAACLVPMQAAAILSGNILLASAVGLSGRARLRYVLAASCAAPFLFFSMCPEQYALSFFWLAMLVLFLSRGGGSGIPGNNGFRGEYRPLWVFVAVPAWVPGGSVHGLQVPAGPHTRGQGAVGGRVPAGFVPAGGAAAGLPLDALGAAGVRGRGPGLGGSGQAGVHDVPLGPASAPVRP